MPPSLVLLTGEPNAGKTWMCRAVLQGLSPLDLIATSGQTSQRQGGATTTIVSCRLEEEESDQKIQYDGQEQGSQPRDALRLLPAGLRVVDVAGGPHLPANWFADLGFADEIKAFRSVGAVVYVVDAQDTGPQTSMGRVFAHARSLNPSVHLYVFVNKVDGDFFGSEDTRVEVRHAFQTQISREVGPDLVADLSVHLTSVYNQSGESSPQLLASSSFLELTLLRMRRPTQAARHGHW